MHNQMERKMNLEFEKRYYDNLILSGIAPWLK